MRRFFCFARNIASLRNITAELTSWMIYYNKWICYLFCVSDILFTSSVSILSWTGSKCFDRDVIIVMVITRLVEKKKYLFKSYNKSISTLTETESHHIHRWYYRVNLFIIWLVTCNTSLKNIITVSYTHLDVYKRQVLVFLMQFYHIIYYKKLQQC